LDLTLTFVFLFLAGSANASAQGATHDVSEACLADLAGIQVYSASKHLENTRDAPSSVTVITGDEIQKFGYRTLADILRDVRGFYVTYDRNYSFVGVRGFGRLGDWNSRVLLMVDGHRLNDLSASLYNILDRKYFDPGARKMLRIRFNRTGEISVSRSPPGFERVSRTSS